MRSDRFGDLAFCGLAGFDAAIGVHDSGVDFRHAPIQSREAVRGNREAQSSPQGTGAHRLDDHLRRRPDGTCPLANVRLTLASCSLLVLMAK